VAACRLHDHIGTRACTRASAHASSHTGGHTSGLPHA
jgi:hypothetical protein